MGARGIFRNGLMTCAAIVCITAPSTAVAQVKRFNVPAQSAGGGVAAFAQQADIQLLISARTAQGKRTNAVQGSFSVEQGLQRLLAGSGLVARSTGFNTYSVLLLQETPRRVAQVAAPPRIEEARAQVDVVAPPAERVADPAPVALPQPEADQEIVVTGSSIRGAPPIGSNLISVGRDAIEDNAVQTVQELLQTVPAVWGGNAASQGAFASFDTSGLQVPQIHGLGGANSSSTLVVMDGHRFPLGGVRRNLPDPNFIPPNAIERVEVLAEGASSIYGSDAVAGVINFISRRRFEGVEATAQAGFGDNYRNWGATLSLGSRWNRGGAAVFYSYSNRGDLHGRDRPLTLPDQRARGGSNFSNFNCGPASIQPTGQALIFLHPYTGPGIANNQTNAPCEQASVTALIPEERRHSLMVKLDQQVGDRLTVRGDIVYSDRRNIARNGVGNTIQATAFGPSSGRGGQINPFYTNPTGSTAASQTVRFSGDDLFPDGARTVAGFEVFYGFASAEYKLSDNWRVTGFAMAGVATSSELITGGLCASCLLLALNGTTNSNGSLTQPSIPNTNVLVNNVPLTPANAVDVWNPRATNRTSPEVLRRLQDSRSYQAARQAMQQYNIKLDGTLFQLPAGDLKIAVGGDIVKQRVKPEFIETNNTGPSSISSSYNAYLYLRTVTSLYGELLIPVISEEMGIPGVRSLVLNISGRYDHYSDFGNIAKPKFAANWEVFDGLKIRGNYAEAFVAPQFHTYGPDALTGIAGLDGSFGPSVGTVNVPLDRYPEARSLPGCNAPGQTTCLIGTAATPGMRVQVANPDVQPTEGKTWAVGADFAPRFLPGLTASLTYWHTSLIGAIGGPQVALIINTDTFHDLLTIYPTGATPAQIDAFRRGKRQTAPLASGPIYFGLDQRNRNIYTVYVEGIDFSLRYRHRFGWGAVRGGVAGTYKTKFDQTAAPGETVFSVLNRNGFNSTFPSNRLDARADIGIDVGPFSASVSANHTGGYVFWGSTALNPVQLTKGAPTGGGDTVGSYTTFNTNLNYDFGEMLPIDVSAFVDIDNIFDSYPPFVNTTTGFDPQLAFPMGRVITVGLRAKF
jgi:iron complex outermembrane recepter protein